MSDIPNYLIPAEGGKTVLSASLTDLLASHVSVMGCSDTLQRQQKFTGNLIVTLPADQAEAVDDAKLYDQGWGHGVADVYIRGLESIGVFMTTSLQEMADLAKVLDAQEPDTTAFKDAQKELGEVVSTVVSTVCALDPDSGSYLLPIIEMNGNVSDLATNVRRDALRLKADAHVIDQLGVIAKLEAQQIALQGQLADANTELAGRAMKQMEEDFAFGMQIASKTAGGLSPKAVAGATITIVGEPGKISKFNDETKKLRTHQDALCDQIASLNAAIAADEIERRELTLTISQISEFASRVKNVGTMGASIIDQFKDWKPRLESFAILGAPPQKGFYEAQIAGAFEFWDGLNAQTTGYKNVSFPSAGP